MIIIDSNVVYKFPVDLLNAVMKDNKYTHFEDEINVEREVFITKYFDNCINNDEMEILLDHEMYHCDSYINKLFMTMIREVWEVLFNTYDISNWATDNKPSSLDFHRDADDAGGIINLDTGRRVVCHSCMARKIEFLEWANSIRRVEISALSASARDIRYVIDHNPYDSLGNFLITEEEGEDYLLRPEELLAKILEKNPDEINNVIPSPTHNGSVVLN
jgi:hypothetical protein